MDKYLKKQFLQFLLNKEGETRSYNELSADLELLLWSSRFGRASVEDILNGKHII